MQLINLIMLVFLPMTILANQGDGHPGDYQPGEYRPGEGHHPHRVWKFPPGIFPIGGYPRGPVQPTGTGHPAGTGSPTQLGSYPTGASHAKRNYPPYDPKPKYDDGHEEGKPRWGKVSKHDGSKPLYPISSTGPVPQPTRGYYPTASSGYPDPTGRPSEGGLRRRRARMI